MQIKKNQNQLKNEVNKNFFFNNYRQFLVIHREIDQFEGDKRQQSVLSRVKPKLKTLINKKNPIYFAVNYFINEIGQVQLKQKRRTQSECEKNAYFQV